MLKVFLFIALTRIVEHVESPLIPTGIYTGAYLVLVLLFGAPFFAAVIVSAVVFAVMFVIFFLLKRLQDQVVATLGMIAIGAVVALLL